MAATNPSEGPRIAGSEALLEAAALLAAGELVAVPTETVYGLAARADNDAAAAAIFRAKGRPSFNPLIVHVSDLEAAERLALFDERGRMLAERYWPGPLTLVLPRLPEARLAPAVSAGLPTVALRSPAHPLLRALLARCDFPLAAPSANRSGAISPTTAGHVAASLGAAAPLILDGGPCTAGIESTIVALRSEGWSLLRPGPIDPAEIVTLLGPNRHRAQPAGIEAPGQLASHYAPSKPLRLEAIAAAADEFLIGFGPVRGDTSLSPTGDLAEAAARLYRCLWEGEAAPFPRLAVAPVPDQGIGAAINDRLRRAAT